MAIEETGLAKQASMTSGTAMLTRDVDDSSTVDSSAPRHSHGGRNKPHTNTRKNHGNNNLKNPGGCGWTGGGGSRSSDGGGSMSTISLPGGGSQQQLPW